MTRKCDLWALAAAALALSSTASAAETEESEASERVTESEPVGDFSVLWGRVVIKAWSDEAFKRELLEDPARALEAHFNYKLPPGARLVIVEGQPGQPATSTLTVTLPPRSDPDAIAALSGHSELWRRVSTEIGANEAFERDLLADPARALEANFNYRLPPGARLQVVKGQPGQPPTSTLTVTLPPMPQFALPCFPACFC
ncbi:hypothetical protein [Polyangium sp. 15x6]|uniref:hypothetical protein n=1 Tax=Polyangium sp. 15x6 TaxID=3042687 RepID=UPI00249A7931|nr:hypothetical protein [Polyangium sp. 15x6]MDI3286586.1 hypothetical protein [Polyangium sp. 15x6]